MKKINLQNLCGLVLFGALACSHLPVKEIPITANPTAEIDKLEAERSAAYDQQVNVLSPKYYEEATRQLKLAQERRDAGKDTKVILSAVEEGRANLDKANNVAKISRTTLAEVVTARADALSAGAPKFREKEFRETDGILTRATRGIESDELADAKNLHGDLLERYKALEISSIKLDKLGPASAVIKQAIDEGAKKNASRTLDQSEKSLSEADAFIVANPHDKAGIQSRAEAATNSANRLLSVSREAKVTEKKDGESIVLEKESLTNKITAEKEAAALAEAKANEEVRRKQSELANTSAKVATLQDANAKLTDEKLSAQRLAIAKGKFDPSEADVYQDGNRLIMRLKKIDFPSGKSNLKPESFVLLGKVQKVIADLGPSKVMVEGHTDAIGAKNKNQMLSEERAKAIGAYLTSNGVEAANVSTVGYGDTKPLSSNKTKEGRAQNRRVDVIVEPIAVSH